MAPSYDIVPTQLVVKALQDGGYRNAAYAIAELIDNSIQAGAKLVELLCIEKEELVSQRRRTRLHQLAVLDNGHGMDSSDLRRALQFGNGGHLNDRSGIGRFGMGLPNSSMSQGERVEVWSWKKGVQNALYSYLDISEISSGDLREVPEPSQKAIPKCWEKTGQSFGKTGTLVVWAKPNRCTWKTAVAIIKNSEELIGRIYRRFLNDGTVTIRMAAFRDTALSEATDDDPAKPNDPLYLMESTSCPEPWADASMAEPWGNDHQQRIRIQFKGEVHDVVLTYSIAKKEARTGHNPGDKKHGRHAARNLGVSIMRAGRELDLDPKWLPTYDTTARWIGVEVEFPPALDEVFGVTNNKQAATHLADLAGRDKEEFAFRQGFDSYQELKASWADDEDIRKPLLDIKDSIDSCTRTMLKLLKAQTRGAQGRRRHQEPDSPEAKATQATETRQLKGHEGSSDEGEKLDPAEKKIEVQQGLIDEGVSEESAGSLAATTIDLGLKYVFGHAASTAGAFFSVKPKGGTLLITLNTDHPAYEHLVALLEDSTEATTLDELKMLHTQALDGLKLLLTAWARYEDEEPDGPRRVAVQESREDWGRVARQFLEEK